MAYASKAGRAIANASRPEAFAVCDRCGLWWNKNRLQFQFEWSGPQLINKQLLFCPPCLDVPQQQLRTIVLPPDPLPVLNARTENFAVDEAGPVTSQIAVAAVKGDTVIFVASVTGFAIAQTVLVQLNDASFAEEAVIAVDTLANSLTVSVPLPYAAGTNGIVTVANT